MVVFGIFASILLYGISHQVEYEFASKKAKFENLSKILILLILIGKHLRSSNQILLTCLLVHIGNVSTSWKFENMESVFLKIRVTADSEGKVEDCNRAVAWAYIWDGSLEGFLADPVNFHVYLETYFKPQNIRDLIRRKIGNGNANYSIKNVKALPLDYLSYMVKSKHTFRYYNIAPETLEKARPVSYTHLTLPTILLV